MISEKAQIQDAPIFPFRGILIDTGRNYFSVKSLKRIVDAMSYNKLNVLHWHMNEQQSFPFVSQRVPELSAYGAYSKRLVLHKFSNHSNNTEYRNARFIWIPDVLDVRFLNGQKAMWLGQSLKIGHFDHKTDVLVQFWMYIQNTQLKDPTFQLVRWLPDT